MQDQAEAKMIDAKGDEVPLRYVKPYDRARDKAARRCLKRWQKARAAMEALYAETDADLAAMEAAAADGRADRHLGRRGNFQFQSFDGLIQVSRSARYELRFDERLRQAQEIIEALIRAKAAGADSDLAELIKGAFRPSSDGLLSQSRVMGLFRLRITDPRWLEAMDLIRESIESRRGKNLLAVRFKPHRDAEWTSIILDVANAGPEIGVEPAVPGGKEGGAK
jgi:hypothetical protein